MARMSSYEKAYTASCVPVHRTKAVPRKTTSRRKIKGPFVFPAKKGTNLRPRFPVPDAYHAKLALGALLRIAGRHGTSAPYKAEARKVLSTVKHKYPHVYACEAPLVRAVKHRYGL